MSKLNDIMVFYQNAVKQIKLTGSIAPSSSHLAGAITSCIESHNQPLHILEAGPGTGPFTRVLAQKMGPADQLDLCELNPTFVQHLQRIIRTEPVFRDVRTGFIFIISPCRNWRGAAV